MIASLVGRTSIDPESTALVFGDRTVSYAEFDARVAVLARELIALGVGPDVAVAVCLSRSVEMMVAVHGVVAAGGQYVPIDTEAPADRAEYMLSTAETALLLTAGDEVPASSAARELGIRIVEVDASRTVDLATAAVTDDERRSPLRGSNAIYTLFTSGSTGRPKGVTVSHRAVLNRLKWGLSEYPWGPADRVVQKTPYTFDVSVPEIFGPLMVGARVILPEPGGHTDPDYIAALIENTGATSVHFVPSMLSAFLDFVPDTVLERLTSLRWLFASGEALPPAVVEHAKRALPNVQVHNLFGPTEAAIEVAYADVTSAPDVVPIGKPVWNTTLRVLDPRLRTCSAGVPGELYLGGAQLARGYARQPGMTAERFIADPFGEPGSLLYRTGDLVRWSKSGDLEYLGRTDFQVKLRGQRIELGEIEAILAGVPGVVHAVATVASAPGGAQHLVGYLSPASVDVDAAREAVEAALPAYMVPTVWTLLETATLNSAGKLDRRALPEPDFRSADAEYEPPVGPLEEQLAALVAGLLGVERVGVTESFFSLGGDSIMSIQLASAMRAAGHALSPRQIFEHRTVRAMAKSITEADSALPQLQDDDHGVGDLALPPVVEWMLEYSDTADDFGDFNQATTLAMPSGIETTDIAEVLGVVVGHHPMLSAALTEIEGAWVLSAGRPFDAAGSVGSSVSRHAVGSEGFDADLLAAHADAAARLNPGRGQLVQAQLVTDVDGVGRLVVVIHHIGVDAVSWNVIIEDLVTVWAQRSAGHRIHLRENTSSQRAWSNALAERVAEHRDEVDYWLERLPAVPTVLGAPLDRARDRASTAVTVEHRVAADVTEPLLAAVPEAFGGGVNDALLAALARAVRSWQSARGIVDAAPVTVLIEGHGRYEEVLATGDAPVRADLSRSVGWFTSIAPLSIDPAADPVHAVKAAKEERLGQPHSGIGFGWLRYHAETDLAQRPMPSIVFNYLGAGGGGEAAGDPIPFTGTRGPAYPSWTAGGMSAQAALTINAGVAHVDGRRELVASMIAPSAVLSREDITDLGARWSDELQAIVDLVAEGAEIGLSPADVVGADLTQDDLDSLATRFPRADVWPLSPLQGGLFFQAELASEIAGAVDVYVAQAALELGAGYDAERLRAAGQRVLDEHRVLRSGFVTTGSGAMVAVVADHVDLPWSVIDLDATSQNEIADRVAEIAREQVVLPFDLAEPPLLRFVLVRHGDTATLISTNHHLILDGWSGPLVLADVLAVYATGATYTAQAPGAGTGDFGDYLALITRRDHSAGLAAWRKVLAPVDGPTLVSQGRTAASADLLPQRLDATVGPELLAGLESLGRRHGATLATVLQASWAVLLSRLTGNQVVTFGETVSGRPADLDGVEAMVGLFINTLPAVVDVDPQATVAQMLEALQASKVAVLDHQHLNLPEIAAAADATIAFDTLTVHESYPVDTNSLASDDAKVDGGLVITDAVTSDATHYPLNMITMPAGDALTLSLKYLPAAFDAAQVQVFSDIILHVLGVFVADADTRIDDIGLADADTTIATTAFASGAVVPVANRTLAGLVGERVVASSGAVALEFAGRGVSFAEFGARVAVLARELIAAGVGPDVAVGVAVDRSVEMVVAVHAVIAAGGQYVPIDVEAPADRVEYMLETAGAGVVLVAKGVRPVALGAGVRVVEVDCDAEVDLTVSAITDAERRGPIRPETAAYTLFTSGSTGRPKGVTVSHRSVVNLLGWFDGVVGELADPVMLLKTPFTFDVSVAELFWPLVRGARLVVAEPGGHRDPVYLRDLIGASGVSVVQFVPSMLSVFFDELGDVSSALSSVQRVHVAGEALPSAVAEKVFAALPQARVFNHYGPTEDAVYATTAELSSGVPVTIGRPVANSSAVVLDSRLRLVPAGVPGELYLGGVQVARGYAARSDLTAERFVADPFGSAGERLYRTGDLVRWNTAGEIEYLGRTDFQVKLRGQRVELGEIESVIASAPGVVKTAATVVPGPGGDVLVGYVSPASVDVDQVREVVGASLPGYMVPSVWEVLDDLMLNSAGKIDRRALPVPDFSGVGVAAEFVAPQTPEEESLAAVFADLLGVDRVSVTESFFDLGGNSLSAMRLAARATTALGVSVSVRDAFEWPTVRDLVAAVAGNTPATAPVLPVIPRPHRIPLAFAQQRMWFMNQLEPESPSYNISTVLRLTGPLNISALREAVTDVVIRHEALRTRFPAEAGVPRQEIASVDEIPGALDFEAVDTRAELEAGVGSGFVLARDLPIRVRVWKSAENEHIVAVMTHHIVSDGESTAPFITDLITAYLARTENSAPVFTPLPVQFADFALWQHRELGDPGDPESVVGHQLEYWKKQLAGAPDVIELPTTKPRPAVASGVGAQHFFELSEELGDRITTLAKATDTTQFMVVHTALAVLLARLSSSDDVVIGTPIAGRGDVALDPLVGMFVNTLALRTRIDSGRGFADVLRSAKATDLEAFANADVPFETIVDAVGTTRSPAFAPLAQVWLTFDQRSLPELAAGSLTGGQVAGVTVEPVVDPDVVPARTDLLVAVAPSVGGSWSASIVYTTDLYDEIAAAAFAGRFVRLLDGLIADPARPVGDVAFDAPAALGRTTQTRPLATRASAGLVGVDPLDADEIVTGGPASEPVLLADLFGEAAKKHGKRKAVTDASGEVLTYAQLDARSNQLAHWLIGKGVGPEDRVILALTRSVGFLTAVWAVAKTGAAYVPVDPDYPAERIALMVEDSEAFIGFRSGTVGLSEANDIAWTDVDAADFQQEIEAMSDSAIHDRDRVRSADPRNPAYVIYTSGSTGRPKGVAVTHTGLGDFTREFFRRSNADRRSRLLGFASPSFDISVTEYLLATASGGLLIYRPSDVIGGADLARFIDEYEISQMVLTPSVLATLDPESVDTVRGVYIGGEAMPPALRDHWAQYCDIHNGYGPTETTIVVTLSEPLDEGEPVTLGGPLAGAGLMVLDDRLRPVGVDVPGELYVCGNFLARGYQNRPGTTAASFVASPFVAGTRMYRTGDVVHWHLDATDELVLVYSGRSDDQVKLRGQRIELGEIETVLAEHPAVRSAVVIGVGGSVATALAAYVVGDDADLDQKALREFAADRLPTHMVPASITVLDELPLTPVGKLDKAALPEPVVEVGKYVAPEGQREILIAGVFRAVLGTDEISATTSFFDMGGNSLAATRVAARASEALGVTFSVRDVFEWPSVRELANAVDGMDAALVPITAAGPRPDRIPLSFAQQRMWFINQFDPAAATYNIPVGVRLTGDLDPVVLRAAAEDVMQRHEILRTTFPSADGEPRQEIHDLEWAREHLDWGLVESAAELADAASRGFDVAREAAFRVRLFREADTEWVLLAVIHHIAGDGESMRPLISDLVTAYAARAAGATPQFAPMEVQFADYAVWQHEVLGDPKNESSVAGRQLGYWAEQLADLPDVLELPADRPRPLVASPTGAVYSFEIPRDVSVRIEQVATDTGVTAFMVVHAALSVLLARLSATDDIAVATPIAGRGDRVLDPMVGMFVNTLVLRTKVGTFTTFTDLLDQVRRVDLEAFATADVPFEAVVDAVATARSQAFAPLAQVMLTLAYTTAETVPDESATVGDISVRPLEAPVVFAQRDLSVNLEAVHGGAWTGSLVYATDLFDESTMAVFARRLVILLDRLTEDTDGAVGLVGLLDDGERERLADWSAGAEMVVERRRITDASQVLRSRDDGN